MSTTRTLSRSFAGGEITPELFGRIDLDRMQTGLKLCKNMIILPHGPAKSRGGFRYLNFAKYPDRKCRLIRFQFSASDSMIIELGHQYARFHTSLGTELDISRPITAITNEGGRVYVEVNAASAGIYDPAITNQTFYITDTDADLNGRWFNGEVDGGSTLYLQDQLGRDIDPATLTLPITVPANAKIYKVYEVATPYDEADLFDIRHAQSLDVVTLTHPDYPAATLSRDLDNDGNVVWTYEVIDFDPASILGRPTELKATRNGSTHPAETRYSYVVTAVSDDGHEESLPSIPNREAAASTNLITDVKSWQARRDLAETGVDPPTDDQADHAVFNLADTSDALSEGDEVVLTEMPTGWTDLEDQVFSVNEVVYGAARKYTLLDNSGEVVRVTGRAAFAGSSSHCRQCGILADLSEEGNSVRLKWTRVAGINRYNVYKRQGVSYFYGYIGQTQAPRFTDKNIIADLTKSPPESTFYFEGDYPAAVTYHDQRKAFAGTDARPQTLWLTKPFTESNISASFPLRPDDAIMLTPRTNESSQIMHAVSLNDIVLLTSTGEIRVSSSGEAVTPTSLSAKPQSYIGAATVQPVMSNKAAIFVENGGTALRELLYKGDVENAYEAQNISVMAPHLFESPVVDLAFQRGREPVIWAVRTDGVLVGCTYMPEQRVIAYHRHDTNGLIESVATAYSAAVATTVAVSAPVEEEPYDPGGGE